MHCYTYGYRKAGANENVPSHVLVPMELSEEPKGRKGHKIIPVLQVFTDRDPVKDGIVTVGPSWGPSATHMHVELAKGEHILIDSSGVPVDLLSIGITGELSSNPEDTKSEVRVAPGTTLDTLVLINVDAPEPLEVPGTFIRLAEHSKAVSITDANQVDVEDHSEATIINKGTKEMTVGLTEHARATVTGEAFVPMYDHAEAVLAGKARARMCDHTSAEAFDEAELEMEDHAQANLYDRASATIHDQAQVQALDHSMAHVYDEGVATANDPQAIPASVIAHWPEEKRGQEHTLPDPERFFFHDHAQDPMHVLDTTRPTSTPTVAGRLAAKIAALQHSNEAQSER